MPVTTAQSRKQHGQTWGWWVGHDPWGLGLGPRAAPWAMGLGPWALSLDPWALVPPMNDLGRLYPIFEFSTSQFTHRNMQSYANTRCNDKTSRLQTHFLKTKQDHILQNPILVQKIKIRFLFKKKTAYKITFCMSLTNKNVITEGLMTSRQARMRRTQTRMRRMQHLPLKVDPLTTADHF